jgi:hypothetical protein
MLNVFPNANRLGRVWSQHLIFYEPCLCFVFRVSLERSCEARSKDYGGA